MSHRVEGTLRDYSDQLYQIYFELGEYQDMALQLIQDFLQEREREQGIMIDEHGYRVALPIQRVPELVQVLAKANIALYQVIRERRL